MMRKRYTDEQIAFALRQAESGTVVAEICRKLGVPEPTFYRWKKQFAGLKQLEEENAKLKRLVADRSLGLPEGGGDRLLQARKAHGQRLHRGIQRPAAGRVLERLVVPVSGRRQATH
jgi:putative transposase